MKQAILVRQDLKMTKGKMAAQVAHASVECVLTSPTTAVTKWRSEGMKKIVLKVPDAKTLLDYKKKAEKAGLVTALIKDGGHTHLEPGTITCLGIGPADDDRVDRVTGELQLYS